jgi:hypothetical protein
VETVTQERYQAIVSTAIAWDDVGLKFQLVEVLSGRACFDRRPVVFQGSAPFRVKSGYYFSPLGAVGWERSRTLSSLVATGSPGDRRRAASRAVRAAVLSAQDARASRMQAPVDGCASIEARRRRTALALSPAATAALAAANRAWPSGGGGSGGVAAAGGFAGGVGKEGWNLGALPRKGREGWRPRVGAGGVFDGFSDGVGAGTDAIGGRLGCGIWGAAAPVG